MNNIKAMCYVSEEVWDQLWEEDWDRDNITTPTSTEKGIDTLTRNGKSLSLQTDCPYIQCI